MMYRFFKKIINRIISKNEVLKEFLESAKFATFKGDCSRIALLIQKFYYINEAVMVTWAPFFMYCFSTTVMICTAFVAVELSQFPTWSIFTHLVDYTSLTKQPVPLHYEIVQLPQFNKEPLKEFLIDKVESDIPKQIPTEDLLQKKEEVVIVSPTPYRILEIALTITGFVAIGALTLFCCSS